MSSLTSARRDAERGKGPSIVVEEEVALGMGAAVLTLKRRPRQSRRGHVRWRRGVAGRGGGSNLCSCANNANHQAGRSEYRREAKQTNQVLSSKIRLKP